HENTRGREFEDPNPAEDQGEPSREHGIKPADQHALNDDVDPFHRGHILNGLKEAPQTRSAPSRRLQPNSGLREFGHLLTGRSWIYPTSAERGGVRGNSPCIQLVDGPPHPLASLHSRCFASAFFAPRTAAEDRLCSPRKRGEVECAASPLPHNSRSEVSGRDRLARERRGRAGERDAALL